MAKLPIEIEKDLHKDLFINTSDDSIHRLDVTDGTKTWVRIGGSGGSDSSEQMTTNVTNEAVASSESIDENSNQIRVDDAVVDTGTWIVTSLVFIDVDGLSEGAHTVEIRFFDNSGNMVSHTVTVTVLPLASSTDPTSSNTTTTDTPPSEANPLALVIIGSSAAGLILVIVGVTVIRKRGS